MRQPPIPIPARAVMRAHTSTPARLSHLLPIHISHLVPASGVTATKIPSHINKTIITPCSPTKQHKDPTPYSAPSRAQLVLLICRWRSKSPRLHPRYLTTQATTTTTDGSTTNSSNMRLSVSRLSTCTLKLHRASAAS